MATATTQAHVESAINFVKTANDKLWIELAKDTAWGNENSPDPETPNVTDIANSLAFVKVSEVHLVYPSGTSETKTDSPNNIIYKGKQWTVTDEDHAYTNNARYALLKATINAGDLPYLQYRQVGVRLGTEVYSEVTTNAVTPDYVSNKGTLIAYENRKLASLTDETQLEIKYLIMF